MSNGTLHVMTSKQEIKLTVTTNRKIFGEL
jgi:hypothetical protein